MPPHVGNGTLQLRHEAPRFLKEMRALGRQLDAAARARKQRRADALLQVADRARQRRLRDVQRCGGAAEMQALGDGDEMAQLAQVGERSYS